MVCWQVKKILFCLNFAKTSSIFWQWSKVNNLISKLKQDYFAEYLWKTPNNSFFACLENTCWLKKVIFGLETRQKVKVRTAFFFTECRCASHLPVDPVRCFHDQYFWQCILTNKMTQYTFPRLPLPDCKMTGYWTISQGGNTRRKLLCPTESHRIDIKVS